MLLDPGNVFANVRASDSIDVLTQMATHLIARGYVKDSFLAAVCEREAEFPTGLPGRDFGIAIPHADSVHVIKPGAALATLLAPVPFYNMGNPDEQLDVKIVCMLLVEDPDKQLEWLSGLMTGLVQNHDLLQRLVACTTPTELYDMYLSSKLSSKLSGKLS